MDTDISYSRIFQKLGKECSFTNIRFLIFCKYLLSCSLSMSVAALNAALGLYIQPGAVPWLGRSTAEVGASLCTSAHGRGLPQF